jgi:ATP-dependent helicase HrpA
MVIAAALSIQDPRERPEEHRQKADELHKRFEVPGSDLLGIVALWNHLRARQKELSNNQFRKLCRTEHLNYLRVREWQDLFSQLRRATGEVGIRPDTGDAHPDHVHRAVMAGLLSHLGMRSRDTRTFDGARGAKFTIGRGSGLAKRPPRWVVAAELVETDRLWARRVAAVQPEWAEELAGHLVKYHHGDAWWDAKRGGAVIDETATLYGLPIVQNRKVDLGRIDPDEARRMFVHHALVEGDWRTHHAFVARNDRFRDRVRAMEARVRREDLLDDTTVEEFFDARVGDDVTAANRFDRWWNRVRKEQPDLLDFTDELVTARTGIRLDDYPDEWVDADLRFRLTYRFDPGGPLDGVNLHVPLTALNQLDADLLGWQVRGHRPALVGALLRALPKEVRRELIPIEDSAQLVLAALDAMGEPTGRIEDALVAALATGTGVHVRPEAFDLRRVEPWLRIHVIVADEADEALDADDDVAALRARLARPLRRAIARSVAFEERTGITTWDMGAIPTTVETARPGHVVRGFPALVDTGTDVSLRVFSDPTTQRRAMRGGVRRLVQLAVTPSRKAVEQRITGNRRLAVAGHAMTFEDLVADCIAAAADRVVLDAVELPWDAVAFDALAADAQRRMAQLAGDALVTATDVLLAATLVRVKLENRTAEATARSVADAGAHLARLVHPGFVRAAGTARLKDVLRHVRAIDHRVDRMAEDLARDHRRIGEVRPLERRYAQFVERLPRDEITPDVVEIGWMLEDLRTNVFAPPLAVKGGASIAKVARRLDALDA